MAIAWDHLGGNRLRLKAELFTDVFFDAWINIGKCSNRARNRTSCDFITGHFEAAFVAIHFRIKARKSKTHRCWFRVDAMAAANANSVLVFKGAFFQGDQETIHVFEKDISCADQLDVETGIQNIGTGHALVNKARFVIADVFGKVCEECNDVMFCDRFDFINTRHIKFYVLGFPNSIRIFARNHTEICHGFAGVRFDFIPNAKFAFGGPNSDHIRTRITRDHKKCLFPKGCWPAFTAYFIEQQGCGPCLGEYDTFQP